MNSAKNRSTVVWSAIRSAKLAPRVEPGEIGKGYKEARGDECTMNPGVLHEVCKKVGHCDTFVNSNVIMEKTKAKGKPNRKDGNNGLEDL